MDDKVLKALKKSIKLWHRRARGLREPRNCPLCRVFMDELTGRVSCKICPVKLTTGKASCKATPYYDYHNEEGKGTKMRLAHEMTGILIDCLPHE